MPILAGRNPILEALQRQRRTVHRILVDGRARPEDRLDRIVGLARARGIPVDAVDRRELDKRARGGVHNGVVAEVDPLPNYSVKQLLEEIYAKGEQPALVLADEISYEHNLGAILRSALGSGIHGVIVPVQRGKGLSPVVARVAMGGAEEVPLVREGLSGAIKKIRREGIRTIGADMDGRPYWEETLTGPVAFVLGGESKGLSPTLRKRCDSIVSVPLAGGLESLNVSVTAAILMFERVRQRSLE